MDELQAAGVPVHTVGKIGQVFDGVGVDVQHKGATNAAALAATAELIDALDGGLRVHQPRRDRPGLRPPQRRPGLPRRAEGDRRRGRRLARAARPGARPARHHRRPRLRPDHARHRPHARARAAARALRGPRRPPPRRPVRGRRRLRAALADRSRRALARARRFSNAQVLRRTATEPRRQTGTHSSCPHWSSSPVGPRSPRWRCDRRLRRQREQRARARDEEGRRRSKAEAAADDAAEQRRAARRAAARPRARALEYGDVEDFLNTSTGAQATKDKRAIAARQGAADRRRSSCSAGGTEIEGNRATLRVDMPYTFDGIDTTYFKTSRMTRGQDARRAGGSPTTGRQPASSRHGSTRATRRARAGTSWPSRRAT